MTAADDLKDLTSNTFQTFDHMYNHVSEKFIAKVIANEEK
jgi:hypothetical protein